MIEHLADAELVFGFRVRRVLTQEAPPLASFGTLNVLGPFTDVGLADSKVAARRRLQQGGLTVNGAKLAATDTALGTDRLLRGGPRLSLCADAIRPASRDDDGSPPGHRGR